MTNPIRHFDKGNIPQTQVSREHAGYLCDWLADWEVRRFLSDGEDKILYQPEAEGNCHL